VIGRFLAEDLQRALHPGASGDRGPGRAAQVRVVEVGQPVGGGPDLAAHPPLLPRQHRVVRAQPGEHGADRVTVPDHHPVDPAHVPRLGADLQPPGTADEAERGLRPGAGDLQGHRAARLGQRPVHQEGASPGRLAVAAAAGHHLPGQPAHRAAEAVDQPGLPGQAVTALAHAHDVAAALAQAAWSEHEQLRRVPEQLGDSRAQPAGDRGRIKLGLDHDVPGGQGQAAGEPQQR